MSENKDPVDPEILKKLGRVVEGVPAERPSYDPVNSAGLGIIKPHTAPTEYTFEINPARK